MKTHTVRFIYANAHHTRKGTMLACSEPHRNDIITPGASTVAKFKTTISEFARFDGSQTERQVNAFIMSCLVTHPALLIVDMKSAKRLGVR